MTSFLDVSMYVGSSSCMSFFMCIELFLKLVCYFFRSLVFA